MPTATPPTAGLQPCSLPLLAVTEATNINLDLSVKIKIIQEVDASTKQKDVVSKIEMIDS